MKKITVLILVLCTLLSLTACGGARRNAHQMAILIPAGSKDSFVYADEEIAATGDKIVIYAGEGVTAVDVILEPVDEYITPGYVSTCLTTSSPVTFGAQPGQWFRVGVAVQNHTDTDGVVCLDIVGVETRKPSENTQPTAPEEMKFVARVLEVNEKSILVTPTDDSSLCDKISVAIPENQAQILQVGDTISIVYDGVLLESYPAQINNVYSIEILEHEPEQPGGTPVEETLTVNVACVNWTDKQELYTKALNVDKMSISSVRHTPIYKFNEVSALKQFKTEFQDIINAELWSEYDDKYFEDNALMLVYIESPSGSHQYGVDNIYHDEQSFCITVKRTDNSEDGTDDMASCFISVEVPNSMIENCTEFDAKF